MLDVIVKRSEAPDETRVFEKGKFEIMRIGGITIQRNPESFVLVRTRIRMAFLIAA